MAAETTTAACPHRPPCPGCPELGRALDATLEPLRVLASEAGVELELGQGGARFGYRQRARLAVRGLPGAPELGIFELGSHRVVDIPSCLVHHSFVNQVAAALRAVLIELRVPPYDETRQRGLVRYAQVVIERGSGSAQIVLVVNANDASAARALCEGLRARLGGRLHSLFVSPHVERGNRILGPRCEHVFGPEVVVEAIAGARVFFPPDAFGQSNLELYEGIVRRIGALVPDGADVSELYAGTGAIGLSLLARVRRVRFNELGAGSLRGLALGLAAREPAERARAEVFAGSAAAHVALVEGADVVIVDPPRKGLDPELCARLAERPPARVLYLSCDASSLARDARALLGGGRLRVASLVAYDLFPNTGHVETLACFERVG